MNQGEEAELIETLWNVNNMIFIFFSVGVFELIETLWNVNVFAAWDNVEMVKEN